MTSSYNFKIISDSSCDLPSVTLSKHNIDLVRYYVTIDGGLHYMREYEDIQPAELYGLMRANHIMPKTSLPPIQDYLDVFRPALDNGQDILCICLTSKFSGSINSANNAFNLLADEYPDRKIRVFDSRMCTVGQGAIVVQAARLRDMGYSMDETCDVLDKVIKRSRIIFTVDSLEYLQRGGRIGKVTAFAGILLNIKPIICMFGGELNPIAKVRGRRKALNEIVNMIEKDIGGDIDSHLMMTVHSDCVDECALIETELIARMGCEVDYSRVTIGTTIGTHIGPTVVGIGYVPKVA
ncbi:MAG: DegV family protein [Clostridiales bacterium]|jgi:DegV family protein with EDD domain|nr:DegV family protein [Clostridiales bacterium]